MENWRARAELPPLPFVTTPDLSREQRKGWNVFMAKDKTIWFQRCINCNKGLVFIPYAELFDGLCRECWCREHHPEIYLEDGDVPF
jgi:hypothetical protein